METKKDREIKDKKIAELLNAMKIVSRWALDVNHVRIFADQIVKNIESENFSSN